MQCQHHVGLFRKVLLFKQAVLYILRIVLLSCSSLKWEEHPWKWFGLPSWHPIFMAAALQQGPSQVSKESVPSLRSYSWNFWFVALWFESSCSSHIFSHAGVTVYIFLTSLSSSFKDWRSKTRLGSFSRISVYNHLFIKAVKQIVSHKQDYWFIV